MHNQLEALCDGQAVFIIFIISIPRPANVVQYTAVSFLQKVYFSFCFAFLLLTYWKEIGKHIFPMSLICLKYFSLALHLSYVKALWEATHNKCQAVSVSFLSSVFIMPFVMAPVRWNEKLVELFRQTRLLMWLIYLIAWSAGLTCLSDKS
jgi:hypothetical protein